MLSTHHNTLCRLHTDGGWVPAQGCWWRCRPGWGRSRTEATHTLCSQTAWALLTRSTDGWGPERHRHMDIDRDRERVLGSWERDRHIFYIKYSIKYLKLISQQSPVSPSAYQTTLSGVHQTPQVKELWCRGLKQKGIPAMWHAASAKRLLASSSDPRTELAYILDLRATHTVFSGAAVKAINGLVLGFQSQARTGGAEIQRSYGWWCVVWDSGR